MEDTVRKLAWDRVQKNIIVMNGNTMINRRQVRC